MFQNFKIEMREGRKIDWLFLFKIKQETYIVTPNWQINAAKIAVEEIYYNWFWPSEYPI